MAGSWYVRLEVVCPFREVPREGRPRMGMHHIMIGKNTKSQVLIEYGRV